MLAIVPAKAGSTRVPNKNWRRFHGNLSLTDILVRKLLECEQHLDPKSIFVASDDEHQLRKMMRKYGVRTILRPADNCLNETSIYDYMTYLLNGVACFAEDDPMVLWAQVCDPLFDDYRAFLNFSVWKLGLTDTPVDSVSVVHRIKQYLMDPNYRTLGWQMGSHHTPSQTLHSYHVFPFTATVMRFSDFSRIGYYIGRYPAYFGVGGHSIDIDTEEDFRVAQLYYAERRRVAARAEQPLES